MKKKIQYKCHDCSKHFISWQKRNKHNTEKHPVTPPPKITVKIADCNNFGTVLQDSNLIGGALLEIGDVFYQVEKCVIKKTTYIEGSDDQRVGYEVTKNTWSASRP